MSEIHTSLQTPEQQADAPQANAGRRADPERPSMEAPKGNPKEASTAEDGPAITC